MEVSANQPVLLIEDNPDDERLALRALKKFDLARNVMVSRDGEEAISALSSNLASELCLILLDLKLPRRTGIEVLKHIRSQEHTKLVPVVVLTSSDEESDIKVCYESGANGYVSKPIDFDGYMETMNCVAAFWLTTNRLSAN